MSTDGFNNQSGSQNSGGSSDELGLPLTILSCIPIVGLILYITNKDKAPAKAKRAGISAIIGFCVLVSLQIIAAILSA
jgi:predicted cation transporter